MDEAALSLFNRMLQDGPKAINIGIQEFAQTLRFQQVEVVQVTWSPPAGGDWEMMDLLDKLL
jgi:FdrA protein